MAKIEALLFDGPMDGMTMEITQPTPTISIPKGRPIFRDKAGKFIFGYYSYDPDRSNHNLTAEKSSGPSQPCYTWTVE